MVLGSAVLDDDADTLPTTLAELSLAQLLPSARRAGAPPFSLSTNTHNYTQAWHAARALCLLLPVPVPQAESAPFTFGLIHKPCGTCAEQTCWQ